MKAKGNESLETFEQIEKEHFSDSLFDKNEKLSITDVDIESPTTIKINPFPSSLSDIPNLITSLDDLSDLETMIGLFRSQGYKFLFRGHADKSFSLLPTIVRNKVQKYSQEKEFLESFKSICKSFGYNEYRMKSFDENLFYLGIGRHLGLFSRLLDWTAGFFDALSFLMDESFQNKDGELWILAFKDDQLHLENRDPFLIDDNKVHILQEHYYLPYENSLPLGIYRRFRQHGFFTVQSEGLLNIPLSDFAEKSGFSLINVSIPKETKALLQDCDRLISLDWLYVDNEEPILKEVSKLNGLFIRS
ncbi:MAG: FRG domain-containing protein [Bacteroidales bacterium]|nr:FRG domain-containing protein [Bacteroidales bacterium]